MKLNRNNPAAVHARRARALTRLQEQIERDGAFLTPDIRDNGFVNGEHDSIEVTGRDVEAVKAEAATLRKVLGIRG